ncbi:LysR family transcriptional regulator, partial [Vibrio anguillarum]|nr:LysR family transcriptional regulator [Vibrio anguillarum]
GWSRSVPRWCVNLFADKEQLKIFNITADIQEPVYLVSKLNSPLARRYEQVIDVIDHSFKVV